MRNKARTILALATALAVLATEIAFFVGLRRVLYFFGASAVSLWLHVAWREALKKRFGPIDPTKEVA